MAKPAVTTPPVGREFLLMKLGVPDIQELKTINTNLANIYFVQQKVYSETNLHFSVGSKAFAPSKSD